MKVVLLLTSVLIIYSCVSDPELEKRRHPEQHLSEIGTQLIGDHKLIKLSTRNTTTSKTNASFFIAFGEYQSVESNTINITFSWLGNDSIYNIGTLPLNKIKIKVDNSVDTPYIKFKWCTNQVGVVYSKYDLMNNVLYAVIVCKESDWQYDVKLNEVLENKK